MNLKLAIASGKGGTGKTTLATNLGAALAHAGRLVTYLDCDVEEPNGHIFLRPQVHQVRDVRLPFPRVDMTRCTSCGICAEACEFKALAVAGDKVLLFSDMCHSCGVCKHICPEKAISEVTSKIGVVKFGGYGNITFVGGEMNIGVARSPAVIEAAKRWAPPSEITIMDSPPGTSCPAVEAVMGSDYVLLVTEPTPFGLNDLKLAVEMLRVLSIPFSVVINRADIGDRQIQAFCDSEAIQILLEIDEDRHIAEAYSRGELSLFDDPKYTDKLLELFDKVETQVNHARYCHT